MKERFDFGVDIDACRENLKARERERYLEREAQRLAARETILSAIRALLPRHPQVSHVYLFGSITRPGDFGADSDIDIAVKGTNAEQYFALWRDLENAASDWLIDLREINQPSYFAEAVRMRGELIYERKDPGIESGYRS